MKMKYEPTQNLESSNANHAKSEQTRKNTIVFSKLLDKFTVFLPFIQIYIENLVLRIQTLYTLFKNHSQNISNIDKQLETLKEFSEKVSMQIVKVKTKLLSQQKTLKTLKSKLKRLASEQRLLKFLPRLRYLSTPKQKMAETVQILMKKFVDPKMTIPMEQIYDEKFKFTSKKIAAARKQKWQRLEKYFGGITKMAKMNKKQISNNIAIIVGQQEEMNAVRECEKLGIKMFTVVDTNCNPKLSNHIIPANDDSRNSVKYILEEMLTHIRLAQKLRQKVYSRKIKKSL
jgi:small subunit ribosomal protein S2